MPKPPSSDPSRRGSPRTGRPPRARAPRPDVPPEAERQGPAWKRRADARSADDAKGKQAGWGGVARKGAGRLRDPEGRGNPPATAGSAADAFRTAAGGTWEPEVWVDEGEVVQEAKGAVGRGRARRSPGSVEEGDAPDDPSLRKAIAASKLERTNERVKEAGKAFRRERYEEARKLLRPIAEAAPTAVSVRELLGLTLYRLGRWKQAVTELEAFTDLTGSTEQHPVLADCYRALGRHARVKELWEDLRDASPSAALVAEGRIVYAGSLADQGRLADAITLLEGAKPPGKKPQEHHLRVAYALADLHERAGDLPRARELFTVVATNDPDLGDVAARLRALR
jgi:hypothetical protein